MAGFKSRMAELVVSCPLLCITQHRIGFCNFLEFLSSLRVFFYLRQGDICEPNGDKPFYLFRGSIAANPSSS